MQTRFNLSEWALAHRALVGYFMLLLAAMGVYGYRHLGQAEDPAFTFKIMVVRTQWPGATAREMEEQVTDRIERKLQETPWLDRLTSYSRPGESTVMVVARDNAPRSEMANVFYQVRKKVNDIRDTLPAGVQGPYFNDEFGDVYGTVYALTGDGLSYAQLKDYADLVRDALLRVPSVAKVELFGVQDQKIYIEVPAARLAALGLDMNQLAQAMAQQNAVAGSGFYETRAERIYLRVRGAYDSVQAVRDSLVKIGSRSVRIGDIGEVKRGYSDPVQPQVRYLGKPALALGITMAQGGDIIQLGQALRARIADLQQQLPVGVSLGEVASQPDAVARSIEAFVHSLAEAVAVVLLVTFISLGMRTGLVVALSIPLVLAVTFFFMYWFDVGLHKVSLGALVLAIGLLVDDAIIAVEMMWVKMEQGWDRTRAASFAFTSTAGPMLSGTLVTVAGFLPIAIAQSTVGQYAFAFFQVNVIALLLSWVAAVVAIPWLGYRFLPDPHAEQNPGFFSRRLAPWVNIVKAIKHRFGVSDHTAGEHDEYAIYHTPFYCRLRAAVDFCLRRRYWVIGVTVLLFMAAIAGMKVVPKQFFPNSVRLELLVEMRLPEGSSLPAVEAEAKRVEGFLRTEQKAHGGIDNFVTYIGSGAPRFFLSLDQQLPASNVAQLVILTSDLEAREALRARLIALFATEFPGLRANIARIENGPPVGYPVQYRLSGTDVSILRAQAEAIAERMRAHPHLTNVHLDWDTEAKVVQIVLDEDKARVTGVSRQDLAQAVNLQLRGAPVTRYREGNESIEVLLRGAAAERSQIDRLASLPIVTRSGKTIPLSQLARLEYGFEPNIIWRRDRTPTVTVRGNIYDAVEADTVNAQILPQLEPIRAKLPAGYRFEVGGTVEESGRGQGSVFAGMPVFILAVVTILMLQLQNFSRVVMVMLTAPLGLIGVALFLHLFHKPFGFMSLLGTIALLGMIMRNSVILIDQIRQDEVAGRDTWTAIVESTVRRFRPILLTATAAVLAMIPLSRNVFFGPMAVSIMGGLIVATVLTLFFLPALYAAWNRVRATEK